MHSAYTLLLLASSGLLCGLAAAAVQCGSCTAVSRPVCGADAISYGNRCLARCQGVRVMRYGECTAQDIARAAKAAVAKTGSVAAVVDAAGAAPGAEAQPWRSVVGSVVHEPQSLIRRDAMQRYRHQGFNLIGIAKEAAFEPAFLTQEQAGAAAGSGAPPPPPPGAAPSAAGAGAVRKSGRYLYQLSGSEAPPELRAALVAAAAALAGDHDAARAAAEASSDGAEARGFAPASGVINASTDAAGALTASLMASLGAGGRRLAHIIGADDRIERKDYPGWPFTAVGQVLFKKGSCSGVMVGPRSVLTAGHCVYSRKRQAWQESITFTPYRHRVADKDTWPVGRIAYTHATTYQGFMQATEYNNALNYDLAVIQLAEDVGYKTGWLGMSWNPKGYKGVIYTAGYPGDKVFGSMWSTSCRVSDAKGTDTRFVTLCDVYPGQSGSPIWIKPDNFTFQLRAVMTYESCRCCSKDCSCCTGKFNGGNAINAMHYASIQAWK